MEGVSKQGQVISCLVIWEVNACKYTRLPRLGNKAQNKLLVYVEQYYNGWVCSLKKNAALGSAY